MESGNFRVLIVCFAIFAAINGCEISIKRSSKVARKFSHAVSNGVNIVYFNLHTERNEKTKELDVKYEDTFDPAQWVWSKDTGKYLLRLPLDYRILSLGILGSHGENLRIVFEESDTGCLENLNKAELTNIIASSLVESVIEPSNSNTSLSDDSVLCRSAFTFRHYFYNTKTGIGYKCCQFDHNNDKFKCNKSYSNGWQLVWVGPLLILLWIYIIIIIGLVRRITKSYDKMHTGFILVEEIVNNLKDEAVDKFNQTCNQLFDTHNRDDVFSFHEDPTFFDILAIAKSKQENIQQAIKIIFNIFLFALYYFYISFNVYFYSKLPQIKMLQDSQQAYVNVFGHMGWLLLKRDIHLYRFAIFEVIIAFLFPFMLLFLLSTAKIRERVKKRNCKQKSGKTLSDDKRPDNLTRSERFATSLFGRTLQVIICVILLIFVVCVITVHVVYCCYFIALGLVVNLDALGAWIIPAVLFAYYINIAFRPLKAYHKAVKDTLFRICQENRTDLLIVEARDLLLPRSLLDDFYKPRCRERIYTIVTNMFSATALLSMLFIVMLSIQYPSLNIVNSSSSLFGVNIVILLPFLASALSTTEVSSSDLAILEFDVKKHVKDWKYNKSKGKINLKSRHTRAKNKVEDISAVQAKRILSEQKAKENLAGNILAASEASHSVTLAPESMLVPLNN